MIAMPADFQESSRAVATATPMTNRPMTAQSMPAAGSIVGRLFVNKRRLSFLMLKEILTKTPYSEGSHGYRDRLSSGRSGQRIR